MGESARRAVWIGTGVAVALLPVVIAGMAFGIGWMEAFGERWAMWLMLAVLLATVVWSHRQARRWLPVAAAPGVRRSMQVLELLWSAELLILGVYGLGAHWWIVRALSSVERTVLLPWAGQALLAAGLGLLLAGWLLNPRLLHTPRILHHDVTVQRQRVTAGALIVWSCFETAGLLGAVVACGTLSLLPFDLLGGGAIASLLAHRLLWFERLVDLVTHPPLVEATAAEPSVRPS